MKRLFVLLFLFASLQAAAVLPVVQIDLSGCGLKGASKFSGLIVQSNNDFYVVSSSWAQMSSELKTRCEKVFTAKKELEVQPVVVDHLYGLSLYHISNFKEKLDTDSGQATQDDSVFIKVIDGQNVLNIGGQVLIASSSRTFIPQVSRVIEWRGAVSSSMVIGAALWDQSRPIGIISHQYLKLNPGSKTKILRWNLNSNEAHSHLTAIPMKLVNEWVEKKLKNPQEPVRWPVRAQQEGLDQMNVGDLELTADCPSEGDVRVDSEYPIGGPDGFGIGGDSIQNKACRVSVKTAKFVSPWTLPSLKMWSDVVRSDLLSNKPISIWYFMNKDGPELKKEYFYSVESFLRTPSGMNQFWVDRIEDSRSTKAPQVLIQAALNLEKAARRCYKELYIREINVQDLVRKLYFYSFVTQSSSWDKLLPKEIDAMMDLKGYYAQGWKFLTWDPAGHGSLSCDSPRIREIAEEFQEIHKKVLSQ